MHRTAGQAQYNMPTLKLVQDKARRERTTNEPDVEAGVREGHLIYVALGAHAPRQLARARVPAGNAAGVVVEAGGRRVDHAALAREGGERRAAGTEAAADREEAGAVDDGRAVLVPQAGLLLARRHDPNGWPAVSCGLCPPGPAWHEWLDGLKAADTIYVSIGFFENRES